MKIHPSIADCTMAIYIVIHRATGCCYVGQTAQKIKARLYQHSIGKSQFF